MNRRSWLGIGSLLGLAGVAGSGAWARPGTADTGASTRGSRPHKRSEVDPNLALGTVGTVDHEANGFHPNQLLTEFDYGSVSRLPGGQVLREYTIVARDREIEIAPGVYFPAWTYNDRVPGPSIRCVEGDRIRITFINGGAHPHTIHFHGIHSAAMDGIPQTGAGAIMPGGRTVYEFDALPFGCHLYHCHSLPLKRHIHKGLYGAFIVDPDPANYEGEQRALARSRNHTCRECDDVDELIMVMNGFDTNFDGDNEVYAVNTIAFSHMHDPIPVIGGRRQRVYLINLTEFDPINSLHLHANFFDYYDHGTTFEPTLRTVDTVMQCQGQRGILEFDFGGFEPGKYMFHAHQSEFAELGWMGFFDVRSGEAPA